MEVEASVLGNSGVLTFLGRPGRRPMLDPEATASLLISELFDFFVPDRVFEPISEEIERLGDDFRGRFLGSTFAAVSSCFGH